MVAHWNGDCDMLGILVFHLCVQTYSVQSLTCCTVAVLGSQRLVPAELIFDLSTMTFASPLHIKVLVIFVHSVWLSMLPFVFFAFSATSSLKLMWFGLPIFSTGL